jgi:hypothetical protein
MAARDSAVGPRSREGVAMYKTASTHKLVDYKFISVQTNSATVSVELEGEFYSFGVDCESRGDCKIFAFANKRRGGPVPAGLEPEKPKLRELRGRQFAAGSLEKTPFDEFDRSLKYKLDDNPTGEEYISNGKLAKSPDPNSCTNLLYACPGQSGNNCNIDTSSSSYHSYYEGAEDCWRTKNGDKCFVLRRANPSNAMCVPVGPNYAADSDNGWQFTGSCDPGGIIESEAQMQADAERVIPPCLNTVYTATSAINNHWKGPLSNVCDTCDGR